MTAFLPLRSGASGAVFAGQNQNDAVLWDVAANAWFVGPIPVVGGVSSVFGRTGVVVAQTGDYDSDQITNLSTVPGASVSDALDALLVGGGAVISVFGRVGAIVAAAGDYTSTQVTNSSGVAGATVTAALNTLAAAIPSVPVSSVFGRTGAVVAAAGDYTSSQVSNSSAVAGVTVTAALNNLGAEIAGLSLATTAPLAGGGLISSGLTLSVATVSNAAAGGVVPGITTALGALVANGAGNAATWQLVTAPTWVGGLREVPDTTARDAIPAANRDVGMTVYDVADDKLFRLIGGTANANWVDVTIGPVTSVVAGTVPAVGATNTVLQSTGSAAVWNTFLALGTPGAASGNIRGASSFQISALGNSDGITYKVIDWGAQTVDAVTVGSDLKNTFMRVVSQVSMSMGGTSRYNFLAGQLQAAISNITYTSTAAAVVLSQSATGTTNGNIMHVRAQGTAFATGVGGPLQLEGGKPGAGGSMGPVRMQLNPDDVAFQTMVEATEIAVGQRVVSLAFGANLTTTQMPANTGDRVVFMADKATIPTADAVGGHVYCSDGGKPFWKFNGTSLRLNGTSASATAGGGAALPLTVATFLDVQIGGTQMKVPAFAA